MPVDCLPIASKIQPSGTEAAVGKCVCAVCGVWRERGPGSTSGERTSEQTDVPVWWAGPPREPHNGAWVWVLWRRQHAPLGLPAWASVGLCHAREGPERALVVPASGPSPRL